jgi:curved DNA-binding protein CbpA
MDFKGVKDFLEGLDLSNCAEILWNEGCTSMSDLLGCDVNFLVSLGVKGFHARKIVSALNDKLPSEPVEPAKDTSPSATSSSTTPRRSVQTVLALEVEKRRSSVLMMRGKANASKRGREESLLARSMETFVQPLKRRAVTPQSPARLSLIGPVERDDTIRKRQSLYEILGVQPLATLALIKKAAHEKFLLVHPDRGGNAADFEEVLFAYRTLSSPTSRTIYDSSRTVPLPEVPGQGKYSEIITKYKSEGKGKSQGFHMSLKLRRMIAEYATEYSVRSLANAMATDLELSSENLRSRVRTCQTQLSEGHLSKVVVDAPVGRDNDNTATRVPGSKPPGPSARYKELEEKLTTKIRETRESKHTVSRSLIIRWAFDEDPSFCDGRNSPGALKRARRWYYAAKRRNNWVDRRVTSKGQKLPDDYLQKWQGIIRRVQAARNQPSGRIPPSHIGNLDQTPILFETVSDTTVDIKGSKSVEVRTGGKHKDRVTFTPTVLADGTKKAGHLTLKAARGPSDGSLPRKRTVAREIRQQTENGYPSTATLRLACNPEAYVYGQELRQWRVQIWGHSRDNEKRIMLLDDYKWHKDPSFCEDMSNQTYNTDIVHIDGGLTPKAQPLDIVINRLIKDFVHEKYDLFALTTPIVNGRMTPPSRQLLAQWITEAWDSIKPDTIIRSFISAGITEPEDYSWEEREKYKLDAVHVDCAVREILLSSTSEETVDELLERLDDQSDDELEVEES